MLKVFKYSPPGNCQDSTERLKHKLCFNVCISLFLTMILVIIMNYTFGFTQILYLQWIVWCVFGTLAFLFKLHLINRVFTATFLLSSGVIFLTIVISITNTIQSPIMPWLCIVPLIAFWLLNVRHALFWLITCFIAYVFFLYLFLNRYEPPSMYNFYSGYNSLYAVFGQVLLLINVYVIGYDFERKKKNAIQEISQKNHELNATLIKLQIAKEELEEAQKHKDIFIAQMSHEMRTPMNAICGVSELLLSRRIEKDLIHILSNSSKQLLNIINDILDISKLQTGKFQIKNITYSLDELIQDVYSYTKKNCDEKNLHLHFSVNSIESVFIKGDPYRLKQVLHNVLSNAVKFTDDGCVTLDVYLNMEEKKIYFNITDTGIGMTEEELKKIFTLFSQANNSIHHIYGGSGIGLNISKQLLELFGGNITIKSNLNSGTEVNIAIPLMFSDINADLVQKEKSFISDEVKNALKNLKILLAEDNEVNRIIFTELIKSEIPQITIDTANNGEEAITKLESGNYDLVIMDIQMPKMNGLQTTQVIRNHSSEKIRNVCIIALSAYARKVEIDECIHAGMNDYLSKPLNKNELLAKAYKLLFSSNNY